MEKKKVLLVWEYPQLTDDPTAEIFDLSSGEKIDEASLDCMYFRDGGGFLIPTDDTGGYRISATEVDKFLSGNLEFAIDLLPPVEERYYEVLHNGVRGKFNLIEKVFIDKFKEAYDIVSVRRIRDVNIKKIPEEYEMIYDEYE